jgi:WD40 repeat protein
VELPGLHFSQLRFSPDGQLLAGGGNSETEVQVGLWDVKTGERVRFWNLPKGRDPHSHVEDLSLTPDGSRLAAAVFRQSAAYIWDVGSAQQIAKLNHKSIYSLSFSADGKTLVTAGWDSIVRFWETDTGKVVREFKVSTEKDDNGVKFAPAPAPNGAINLNQRVGDLRMYAVCYAPEGNLIATAHMDNEVGVWKADSMQPQMRITVGSFGYASMSFSPDGLYLATGSRNGSIEL